MIFFINFSIIKLKNVVIILGKNSSNFGTSFPKYANKGDTFVRVDVLPNKLFRFDGTRWLVVVKRDESESYLHDQEYVKYLISSIENGTYNVEMLSDNEKTKIEKDNK